MVKAFTKTYHAFKATAVVAYKFVDNDSTLAATPYESPSYRVPVPSASGSNCDEPGPPKMLYVQVYWASTVAKAMVHRNMNKQSPIY